MLRTFLGLLLPFIYSRVPLFPLPVLGLLRVWLNAAITHF